MQCSRYICIFADTPSVLPQWANDLGSIASKISLGVSLYVAWRLQTISRHYRQLIIIPKIKTRIRGHLKNLDTLSKSKDWPAFRTESAAVAAAADQAKSITFGSARQSANLALIAARSITSISATSFQAENAEQLVLALTELEVQLGHFVENKKWQ
jgi:hypothetical protein